MTARYTRVGLDGRPPSSPRGYIHPHPRMVTTVCSDFFFFFTACCGPHCWNDTYIFIRFRVMVVAFGSWLSRLFNAQHLKKRTMAQVGPARAEVQDQQASVRIEVLGRCIYGMRTEVRIPSMHHYVSASCECNGFVG